MKKITFLWGSLLLGVVATAQVGVNKEAPNATLDVEALKDGSSPDGLLIPRLKASEVKDMDNLLGIEQQSMLIYVSETFNAVPSTGKCRNIDALGYYYYDHKGGEVWKKLVSAPNVYTAGSGIDISGTNVISSQGLEKITEGTSTGLRLVGKNPAYYGNIGVGALDFSTSNSNSNTLGATGENSVAMGVETSASGHISTALGWGTVASGNRSLAVGQFNSPNSDNIFSVGIGDSGTPKNAMAVSASTGNVAIGKNVASIAGDAAKLQVAGLIQSQGIGAVDGGATDRLVVADSHGVLKTIERNNLGATYTAGKGIELSGTGNTIINATGLEKLTESTQTGWRLIGGDTNNYGNIGEKSVDLSYSSTTSTSRGATGETAVAMGKNTTASGDYSTAIGYENTASGEGSLAVGKWNIPYVDNVFSVGTGTQDTDRKNAFVVTHKNNTDYVAIGKDVANTTGNVGQLQVKGLIQSEGIGSANGGATDKLVVADTNGILKTIERSSVGATYTAGAGMKLTGTEFSRDGLEKVTESGKTGWRLVGQDPANYGDIGDNAVDLSISNGASAIYGATGQYSTAMGAGTTASGQLSTAMGRNTTASGLISTAIGDRTTASGAISTAMGKQTNALGDRSTAMGFGTTASGLVSTAMGDGTKALGDYSTAMGNGTTASGESSITMGRYNIDDTKNILSVGTGNNGARKNSFVITTERVGGAGSDKDNITNANVAINKDVADMSPGAAKLQVNGLIQSETINSNAGGTSDKLVVADTNGILKTIERSSVGATYTAGAGMKLSGTTFSRDGLEKINEGGKVGWRLVGQNSGNYGNIGTNAVDLSISNTTSTTHGATGWHSTALGLETTASGNWSTAIGSSTIASGHVSTVMGSRTTASGEVSTAMGSGTIASGENSTAMGLLTTASGESSVAMGRYNVDNDKNILSVGIGRNGVKKNSLVITTDRVGGISSNKDDITNANIAINKDVADMSAGAAKLQVNGLIQSETINSNAGGATDRVVVADSNGILKTIERSSVGGGSGSGSMELMPDGMHSEAIEGLYGRYYKKKDGKWYYTGYATLQGFGKDGNEVVIYKLSEISGSLSFAIGMEVYVEDVALGLGLKIPGRYPYQRLVDRDLKVINGRVIEPVRDWSSSGQVYVHNDLAGSSMLVADMVIEYNGNHNQRIRYGSFRSVGGGGSYSDPTVDSYTGNKVYVVILQPKLMVVPKK